MANGSCFCKKIQIECTNQPITSAICHCADCRRATGSLFTYSFIFKAPDVRITGSLKEVAKIADSGNLFKHYFCPDCGTPIYGVRIGPSGVPDENRAVRAGVFDDIRALNQWKPEVEIYTEGRVGWGCPIEGAQQFVGMLSAVPE